MDKVELVYTKDCPNIESARKALLKAFNKAKVTPHWLEWDINDPGSPAHIQGYGSPTILINGTDVMDKEPIDSGNSCRIYLDPKGERHGAPFVQQIITALNKNNSSGNSNRTIKDTIRYNLAVIPTIGITLLPKLTCPVCWPAYTAILSSMGIGFVNYTPYLFPLTIIFLVVAVLALYYQSRIQKKYMPFIFGFAAALVIIVGKFGFDNNLIMYFGLAILLAASLWNIKYTMVSTKKACAACESSSEN